jgi:hypothetical protein
MPATPVVPETITVHLGPPGSSARNVEVPFAAYIKNVASHEIYPTWPESAIRANILAQISYALNRVYTEYYRTRGYDYDITNTTQYDQAYVEGGDVFENISQIVDDSFNNYIVRQGSVEPLFAQFCDGVRTQCGGLSQWGSVDLAQDGMIVVVVSLSGETGDLVSGPDIITRGFVYVKESEGLMDELREVALDSLEACQAQGMLDWASIKSAIKSEMSRYLYRKTKRNPMILPVIMEV